MYIAMGIPHRKESLIVTLDTFFEMQKARIGKVQRVDPNRKHTRRQQSRIDPELGVGRKSPQIQHDYARLRIIYE